MKPCFTFLIGVFLVFFFITNLNGQQKSKVITGTIILKDEPLMGTLVTIPGTSIGTTTDLGGSFSFETQNLDLNRIIITETGYSSIALRFNGSGEYLLDNGIEVNMQVSNKHVCSDGDIFTYPDNSKLVFVRISYPVQLLLDFFGNKPQFKEYNDQLFEIRKFVRSYLDQTYNCFPPDPCLKKSVRSNYYNIEAQISKGNKMLTDMLRTFNENKTPTNGLMELKAYYQALTKLSKVDCE